MYMNAAATAHAFVAFAQAALALPDGVPHDARCDWCQVLDASIIPIPPPSLRLCVEHARLASVYDPKRTDIRFVLKSLA
jgi:hypothetical protein